MPTSVVTNLGPCDCCGQTVLIDCCSDRPIAGRLYLTVTSSSCADGTFPLGGVYEVDFCGNSGSTFYWIGVADGCTADCPNIVVQIDCPGPGLIQARVYLYVAGSCVSGFSGCTFRPADTTPLACDAAFPWATPTSMSNLFDAPHFPCCPAPATTTFSIDETP